MAWSLGLWVTGLAALAVGYCVAINTSLGGTRSDYQDSSGLWVSLGGIILLIALVGGIWNTIEWLTAQ